MSVFLNRKSVNYLFLDWFGVLSTNYYWCVQSKKNRLLKKWCDCVFDDSDILNEWMRGKFSLEYLAEFRVKVSPDFLVKSFLKDIKYYEPDYQLLTSLANLFPNSRKVLVTDNLPLFNYILKEYKDLNSYFYKIYQSHEVGVLKNDQPNSLFDFIQMDLNLCSFQNSLLIDDNHLNCENFKTKGGKTILIG